MAARRSVASGRRLAAACAAQARVLLLRPRLAGLGQPVLGVPAAIWDTLDDAVRWAVNRRWLDEGIALTEDVILAVPRGRVPQDSTTAMEIDYLLSKGYRFMSDTVMIASGK